MGLGTIALAAVLATGAPDAARVLLRDESFEEGGSWKGRAQRPEIAPRFRLDPDVRRAGRNSLAIGGAGRAAGKGCWAREVEGIEPGAWYALEASYRTARVPYPSFQVVCRLDWRRRDGRRAGQPDYLWREVREGAWTRVEGAFPAPDGAARARIELMLRFAAQGTVWWDAITFRRIPRPPRRRVRVAAIFRRPRGTPEQVRRAFLASIEEAAAARPDIVCLPEAMNLVGTGRSYVEAAEPIPGPTTRGMARAARAHRTWIVAGLLERDGGAVYNTAVLIDREGRLAGTYRKVHLPREELEGGVAPGSAYPVFRTDFGIVGLMICWDVQFPETAQALALRGAEILLVPIWGGNETLVRARAIENHIFLVSAGYDMRTFILDPVGEVVAEAKEQGVAAAEIDLSARFVHPWLGDMRGRFFKENRPDVPVRGGAPAVPRG